MLLIRVVARHIDIRLIINFQLLKPRRVKGCGILNIQINNRLVITRRILALATVLARNDYSFQIFAKRLRDVGIIGSEITLFSPYWSVFCDLVGPQ